jgi:hypothetical protein
MNHRFCLSGSCPERRFPGWRQGRLFLFWIVVLAASVSLPSPGSAFSVATGDAPVSNDPSLLEKMRLAREYKQLYGEVWEAYEESRARYEEIRQELKKGQEAILLHRGNEEDLQELIRWKRVAWGRLYRQDGRSRTSGFNEDSEVGRGEAGDARFFVAVVEPSGGTWITRLWRDYRVWKQRYEDIREAFQALEMARELLEEELRMMKRELQLVQGKAGDSRSLLERKMDAWARLYRD